MKYRPDIDGLRAVAVIPVVLFHARLPWLGGGFLGVDVFFVISGFLITRILLEEVAEGRFSIPGFYERRARRILPALFAMMILCVPFALLWMLPADFASFSRSMAAVVLFVSNVHFLEHADYFTPAVDVMPLLHTWSLAVEEQYYLLFPLLLLAMARCGDPARFWVMAALAAASLAVAEWGWRNYPAQNFFFSPSRFWELLAGSMAALLVQRRGFAQNGWLAAAGLAAILAAMVLQDEATPFPSVHGLVPVLGAVCVLIWSGPGTVAGRLLSWRPAVFVGLISYSTYLWHQPVLALPGA